MAESLLITGGAQRIGAAAAARLAGDGWRVIVQYHRSREAAQALQARIAAGGGQCVLAQADLADPNALKAVADVAAGDADAPWTALINNASIFQHDALETVSVEALDAHYAIHVQAPALLARRLSQALPVGGSGCVINMLDYKLFNLNPDYLSYTLSKYALLGMTRALATDAQSGLRVCGVAPGFVLPVRGQAQEDFDALAASSPLKRNVAVDDILDALRHILSTSLNGQVICVDAGRRFTHDPRDPLA